MIIKNSFASLELLPCISQWSTFTKYLFVSFILVLIFGNFSSSFRHSFILDHFKNDQLRWIQGRYKVTRIVNILLLASLAFISGRFGIWSTKSYVQILHVSLSRIVRKIESAHTYYTYIFNASFYSFVLYGDKAFLGLRKCKSIKST